MNQRTTKYVTFGEYVKQALYSAKYENDTSLGKIPCVVGEVPQLTGCYTQGESFEEARENLREAIELWVTITLQRNEELPILNGYTIIRPRTSRSPQRKKAFA
mgnify:CR=1 FL=1